MNLTIKNVIIKLVVIARIPNKFGGKNMALVVKNVDERTIRRMASEYLSGSYVSLKTIATKYRTTATTISNILWRGVAENIIDTRVAKCIYNKIVDKPSIGWYQRKMRWDEAFDRRDEFIKEQEREAKIQEELLNLEALKEYYEHAIASYDNYFIEENDGPSLEELQYKLDEVIRKIEALS